MTSAFICELQGGPVCYAEEIAAETLEYGGGNWWNSTKMLAHLRRVIELRKKLFPWARVVWRFDHSSNHTAMAEDALNTSRMNIGIGGKQAKMRDTVLLHDTPFLKKGTTQIMVWKTNDEKCYGQNATPPWPMGTASSATR